MASGMATIASDFPLYKTIVEEVGVGLNVNPLSATEIAEAVHSMNEDTSLWESFCRKGIEMARANFNWNTEKEKLYHIYESLLAKK